MTTNPPWWKHRHYRHWAKNPYQKSSQNKTKRIPKPVENPEQEMVSILAFLKTPPRGCRFRYQKRLFFIRGLSGLVSKVVLPDAHLLEQAASAVCSWSHYFCKENVYEIVFKKWSCRDVGHWPDDIGQAAEDREDRVLSGDARRQGSVYMWAVRRIFEACGAAAKKELFGETQEIILCVWSQVFSKKSLPISVLEQRQELVVISFIWTYLT